MFDVSTTVIIIGDGHNALFYHDCCLDGRSLQYLAPNLCAAVHPRTRATRLVSEALQNDCWIRDISGALGMASLEQYVQLWERVQGFHLQNGVAAASSGNDLPTGSTRQSRCIGHSSTDSVGCRGPTFCTKQRHRRAANSLYGSRSWIGVGRASSFYATK
jgi:hypothetical protein